MNRISLAFVAAGLLVAPAAWAQNIAAEPLYGTSTLNAGFLPDPAVVSVTAGGPLYMGESPVLDAVTGAGCNGYITPEQPDHRLIYSGGPFLRIGARAEGDTTLLVNLPDGTWRCIDDRFGFNPGLDFTDAPAGQYDIWVGVFADQTTVSAELLISELADETPFHALAPTGPPQLWADPGFEPPPSGPLGPLPLDGAMPPNFGTYGLAAGFMPDPFTMGLQGGGSTDLTTVQAPMDVLTGMQSFGNVSNSPDFVINWQGGSYLRFEATYTSEEDLIMLIQLPDGTWRFNDDFSGLQPAIEFETSPAGAYRVWVGNLRGTWLVPATLGVTEIRPVY